MSILSPSRINKQILQNTRDIMEHLGIQEKEIAKHTKQLQIHDDRLEDIETKLRELSVPHGRRAYVLSADAKQVADDMDLTITDLYRVLRRAGLIIPESDHSTQTQRVNGQLRRVLVFKKGADTV